ncbi:MAG: hypothetical protein H6738_15610 [Alphaproteobacteria bacterium]|nr:hypothetical protein [Alphaproteobacteria bacterium]MCB9698205.1 hypothetical protein [Alphaproteobacteria bacterium]
MLVGSGGVVALVLGAWSMVWALRVLPRTTSRGWWPLAVAWVAAMLGFALMSSFEETLLGLFDVLHAVPDERVSALDAVRGWWLRPLAGATIASLMFGCAVVVAGTPSVEPVDADHVREPLPADRLELALVAVAVLLALGALTVLAMFAQELGTLEATLSSLVNHGPSLESTTQVGIVVSSALILVATSLAGWRGFRSWRARKA